MINLYEPVALGALELTSRVVMAPLTRNRADDNTGEVSLLAAEYYTQRATAGLIISEATCISPTAKGYYATPGIYTDKHIESWRQVTDAVHNAGGKIVVQLWHVGRISHESVLPEGEMPVAPSAISAVDATTVTAKGREAVSLPRALHHNEIEQVVSDYKHAAECAKLAGFDGVEIHSANGYLLDQFLQDKTNKRKDEYGGSAENRARLLLEVVDAVTSVWGADRVGVRLSPLGQFNDMGDSDPLQTFGTAIHMLSDYNLAYLHFVEIQPRSEVSEKHRRVLDTLRRQWTGQYIANGDYDKQRAEVAVESGRVDAVAFGRPYIANPDLVERLQHSAPLNEADPDTIYGGGAEGYIDYPFWDDQRAA